MGIGVGVGGAIILGLIAILITTLVAAALYKWRKGPLYEIPGM